MHTDLLNISYSAETIRKRVGELGRELKREYADKNPIFLGILKGAFVFMADLARACDFPLETQFLKASSYGGGAASSGTVNVDLAADVRGRHVVVVEDILDTGITLSKILQILRLQDPASVRICALLDKCARRETPVDGDYVGFRCEASFFVGYGLDYAERYRNLPYIGVLKPEIYS